MSPHPDLNNIVLYTSTVCPYAQRARMALAEVYGHDDGKHEEIEVDFDDKPAWYVEQVNPTGQVPALKVGEEIFTESLRIVEFIADCSEDTAHPLMPRDALTRARVRRFIDAFGPLVIAHLRPIYARADLARVPRLLAGLRAVQAALPPPHPAPDPDAGPFFLGAQFSAADIAVAPFLGRMYALARAGLIPDVLAALTHDAAYARFDAYARALFARPSFERTFVDEKILVDRARRGLCVG